MISDSDSDFGGDLYDTVKVSFVFEPPDAGGGRAEKSPLSTSYFQT